MVDGRDSRAVIMMSRLYLFPLCSITRAVWSSVRLDTHVDKVLPANVAKRVWLCAAEAGYRTCAYPNDCRQACDQCAGSRPFPRSVEPRRYRPCHRASHGTSLAPTFLQVHEMQSRLARFAFAITWPAGYQSDAFQASSPKTSRVAFRGPFFCLDAAGTAFPVLRATGRSRIAIGYRRAC